MYTDDETQSMCVDPLSVCALNLFDQLIETWNGSANATSENDPSAPLQAFLLLDNWRGNPIASELERQSPLVANERGAVPEELFSNREDDAPCLVPLPAALCVKSPLRRRLRDDFGAWIARALLESEQRNVRLHLCGVVMSRASKDTILRHLKKLGHQDSPSGGAGCLFRYQDPRVMQRVWPLFRASQRKMWLGPIEQWWSLAQPWGPWAPSGFGGRVNDELSSASTRWFRASTPTREELGLSLPHVSIHLLLDHAQWKAAHSVPIGNRVWARFASDEIATADQPDAAAMERLIGAGRRAGMSGKNLEDFARIAWRPEAPCGPG